MIESLWPPDPQTKERPPRVRGRIVRGMASARDTGQGNGSGPLAAFRQGHYEFLLVEGRAIAALECLPDTCGLESGPQVEGPRGLSLEAHFAPHGGPGPGLHLGCGAPLLDPHGLIHPG